jgi:hypothetical protein
VAYRCKEPASSEVKPREPVILVVLTFYPETALFAYPEILEAFLMQTPYLFSILSLMLHSASGR